MKCPKCGARTQIKKTINKRFKTFRDRQCKKCGFKFETVEMVATDWNYKAVVKNIKKILDDIE